MVAISLLVTAFESPVSPIYRAIHCSFLRTALLASAIGLVLALLIHSPWGKRSGAHLNPAVTLTFLRLKKIHPWDALFYVVAQLAGGTLGVILVAWCVGRLFTDPPVHYAIAVPGSAGEAVAFVAELVISCTLMAMILAFTTSPRLIRFTGVAIGGLVAFWILVEAPLSGTSMNPARTLASAVPGMLWQHLWIYLVAPTVGMLIASQIHLNVHGRDVSGCAKLLHPQNVRCIHCGYLCHQD
jgi:aquaporin Z